MRQQQKKEADNSLELSALVAGGGFEVSFSRFFVAMNINTLHFGRGSLDSIFVPNLSRNKFKLIRRIRPIYNIEFFFYIDSYQIFQIFFPLPRIYLICNFVI